MSNKPILSGEQNVGELRTLPLYLLQQQTLPPTAMPYMQRTPSGPGLQRIPRGRSKMKRKKNRKRPKPTQPYIQRLLTGELIEIIDCQSPYGNVLIKKTSGRPYDRLTAHSLLMAMRICELDIQKKGKIWLSVCPEHQRRALTYRYQRGDGVHVWCEYCGWTTHFDEYNYHPIEDPTYYGEGNTYDNSDRDYAELRRQQEDRELLRLLRRK